MSGPVDALAFLIGVDEVGRGCLAGPVTAGAFCFHSDQQPPAGLRDSKKLSPKQRQALLGPLAACGFSSIGNASEREIDALNIKNATFLAMRRALDALRVPFDQRIRYAVVIDGNVLPDFTDMGWGSVTCLVKADDLVPAVSAASVIAKEDRDGRMARLAEAHIGYGLESNAGYGSPLHLKALSILGYSEIHRKSFEPVKSMVQNHRTTPKKFRA